VLKTTANEHIIYRHTLKNDDSGSKNNWAKSVFDNSDSRKKHEHKNSNNLCYTPCLNKKTVKIVFAINLSNFHQL